MTRSIEQFAQAHASRLRKKFADQVKTASRDAGEKDIHDLRVSIRRLSECLIVFRPFFPPRKTKKKLKRLEALMDLAAKVRNRDIAVELIGSSNPGFSERLMEERSTAKKKLARALNHRRWRAFH